MRKSELFKLVSDAEELIVGVLESRCYTPLPTNALANDRWMWRATHFCWIRAIQSKFRRKRVPMRVSAPGAGSGLSWANCILSTISASFSSVEPVVSYAWMPYSFSSSFILINSCRYSSISSWGNWDFGKQACATPCRDTNFRSCIASTSRSQYRYELLPFRYQLGSELR